MPVSPSTPDGGGLESVREILRELLGVVRRVATLDPRAVVRIRVESPTATVFARLPFAILVSRSVEYAGAGVVDTTVGAAGLLAWLDEGHATEPQPRDAEWRTGLPPHSGWQRVDTVPDDVVRSLVRHGALALKDAAQREGVPGAQPRADVADALLDSVVLTVSGKETPTAEITLRALSALTRMGFLPRGSHIAVAVAGRWTRVAGEYGSVYSERPDHSLNLVASPARPTVRQQPGPHTHQSRH
jgi:hypothetical protein